MRVASASTSRDAYYAMIAGPKLGEQQREIISFLAKNAHRDYTRSELAEAMPMRLSSVCGRVHELLQTKVIEEGERRPDEHTGVSAHPVRLVPLQDDLFGEAA